MTRSLVLLVLLASSLPPTAAQSARLPSSTSDRQTASQPTSDRPTVALALGGGALDRIPDVASASATCSKPGPMS